jgi:hypothetical protein
MARGATAPTFVRTEAGTNSCLESFPLACRGLPTVAAAGVSAASLRATSAASRGRFFHRRTTGRWSRRGVTVVTVSTLTARKLAAAQFLPLGQWVERAGSLGCCVKLKEGAIAAPHSHQSGMARDGCTPRLGCFARLGTPALRLFVRIASRNQCRSGLVLDGDAKFVLRWVQLWRLSISHPSSR